MHTEQLAVRFVVGDVSRRGFEALQLSVWGARHVFGADARYVICVHSLPLDEARARTGPVPTDVEWRATNRNDLPEFFQPHLGTGMKDAEAWSFSPPRLFPDKYELVLANDCILWDAPEGMRVWLDGEHEGHVLVAGKTQAALDARALGDGSEAGSSGIFGIPPGDGYEESLRRLLDRASGIGIALMDAGGVATLALHEVGPVLVVRPDEVTTWTELPAHPAKLGSCGVRFLQTDAQEMGASLEGRPDPAAATHAWDRWLPEISLRVGLRRDTPSADPGWEESMGPTERARQSPGARVECSSG